MKAAKADCDEQINQVITLTMEQECLLDTSIVPIFGVRGFIPMGVFPWFLALCMFGFVAFGIALGHNSGTAQTTPFVPCPRLATVIAVPADRSSVRIKNVSRSDLDMTGCELRLSSLEGVPYEFPDCFNLAKGTLIALHCGSDGKTWKEKQAAMEEHDLVSPSACYASFRSGP